MSHEPKTVRRQLLAAGYLACFTALLHLIGGTIEIHEPLMTSQLTDFLRLLLLACWHLVSVALLVSGPALLWCARPARQASAGALALFIGAMWLGFGAVFVAVDVVYQGMAGLALLPQWTLLLPVGALATLGGRRLLGELTAWGQDASIRAAPAPSSCPKSPSSCSNSPAATPKRATASTPRSTPSSNASRAPTSRAWPR